MLFSCGERQGEGASGSGETMMTEYSENLSVVMSQNGRRSYHFVTPLLEGYSQAREPYPINFRFSSYFCHIPTL